MKNGSTLMVENDDFSANAGFQWKQSSSAYSFCWQANPAVGI
jgi:hypothetical protein